MAERPDESTMSGAHRARPHYDEFTCMSATRAQQAVQFSEQILATCEPFHSRPYATWDVLDVGSGYGHTTAELARRCRTATGLEPARDLYEQSTELVGPEAQNLQYRCTSVYELTDTDAYDLVVLDNVYEHLPDHATALEVLSRSIRPGGLLYILTPNKLWPIEAHYRLPLLALLPLRVANAYLRLTKRGVDYLDASYAPTYWSLKRAMSARHELTPRFVLPRYGSEIDSVPLHYRAGMAAIARVPALWSVSKSLLVVAVKS